MRTLRYLNDRQPVEFPADCKRIVEVMARYGFTVSMHEAERMWQEYSEGYCAGWMTLPVYDDDIFLYLTEETEW